MERTGASETGCVTTMWRGTDGGDEGGDGGGSVGTVVTMEAAV